MDIVKSIDGHEIRLTDERWLHISIGHPEVADLYYEILQAVAEPDMVLLGNQDELMAVRKYNDTGKYIVVVYKQTMYKDGFVITAFITNKLNYLSKKKTIWPLQK